MEKSVGLLFLVGALGLASADRSIFNQRLCPDGYHYAGEDTPKNHTEGNLTGVAWEEKLHTTDPYSCYKIVEQELNRNISKVPFEMSFNHLVDVCGDDKAKPVALEDLEEADRLINLLIERGFEGSVSFLTSGMFFNDVNQWIWLGSNMTAIDTDIYNFTNTGDDKQCLVASVEVLEGSEFHMSDQALTFYPVECNKRSDLLTNYNNQPLMVCEVRAVTVTYLAWFYSNWMTFLLVLMTTMLMVALCLSVFKYKGGRSLYANRRVYRADARTTQRTEDLPYGDNPPTYSDVTGIVDETQQSKMDKYKNKGKEILAKVTLYKNTSN